MDLLSGRERRLARLRGGAYRLRRRQRLLELLRVLVGQRGLDHRSAVTLEGGDGLVGRCLLDDHEERRRPRLDLVADLLLELLVDRLLSEMAEECAEPGADCESRERDEEDEAEQEAPEASPERSPAGRCA